MIGVAPTGVGKGAGKEVGKGAKSSPGEEASPPTGFTDIECDDTEEEASDCDSMARDKRSNTHTSSLSTSGQNTGLTLTSDLISSRPLPLAQRRFLNHAR